MAFSITSSANFADNASNWTITWTGFVDPLNKVEIDLRLGVYSPDYYDLYHAGTTGSINAGTYSFSVNNTIRTNFYNAFDNFTLTNAISLVVSERSYIDNSIISTRTISGTPVINNRLTALTITSPTTGSPINLDLANPANITASWTRPLNNSAFFARVRVDVGNAGGGTSTSWTSIYSASPYSTSYNADVVSVGFNDEMITAMNNASPKDIRVRIETLFRTGASSYLTLSGTSDSEVVGSGLTYTFVQKSTISFNDFTINSSLVTNNLPYTLTKFEDTATHTVRLYVNSTLVKTVTGITASGSLDIDSTDLSAMLSATDQVTSATAYLTVETFVGATSYGLNNSNNVTTTVDAGYVPAITAQAHAENTTSPNVASLIGKYVKSISTIKFTLSGNTTGTGTRIKQIKAVVSGQTITTDYTYASNTTTLTNANLISSALTVFGTNLVATITITDYRNRSTTYTWNNLEILDYSYPSITSVLVNRANSGGSGNPLGVFMNVTLNASVKSLVNSVEKNELYYRIGYKVVGAGSYNYYLAVDDVDALTFNATVTKGTAVSQEFAVTSAYDIVVEVYDVLTSGNKTYSYNVLPKGYVSLQIGEDYISVNKVHSGVGSIDVGNKSGVSINLDAGIRFPATQVANADVNVLDDYEEGTFTPTIKGTGTAGTGTYSTQVGRYTKVGNFVKFAIDLTWSAHTGTTNMVAAGLPIASTSAMNQSVSVYVSSINLGTNYVIQGVILAGTTEILLARYTTGGSASAGVPIDTAGTVIVSGEYFV